MPNPETGTAPDFDRNIRRAAWIASDFDRHFRRAVWIAWSMTMFGALVVYSQKAADDRSAFIRWRHQVIQFWDGVNIFEKLYYPNPPIMPISLYPLMALPPVTGAVCWFIIKSVMTVLSVWFCFRMVRPPGTRVLPSWIQFGVLVLSLRPILSDLHHGNNNLLIMFLVVAALYAWREGYDILAGLILGLAIAYKVTPALFVPYFMYKRSWRTVASTFAGLGLFLIIVPSAVIGPAFNWECLSWWWQRMMSPFIIKGESMSPQEVNQSLVGVLTRLLTETKAGTGRYDVHLDLNIVAWSPVLVRNLIKVVALCLVGLLAFFCRTKTTRRDDPRLLGEFALVVLTMLFVSERSWKHHYVTVLLPYTYLVYRVCLSSIRPSVRIALAFALALSTVLMGTTSSEIGGHFAHGNGHKIAQFYGAFLWAGVVLYIATAWRVYLEGRSDKGAVPLGLDSPPNETAALPHFKLRSESPTVMS